jgi:hypothetical protein
MTVYVDDMRAPFADARQYLAELERKRAERAGELPWQPVPHA